ncbi:MAG: PQQ-binding-like beta-propeller repeat protein [candidate division WOR-3 bacterium]
MNSKIKKIFLTIFLFFLTFIFFFGSSCGNKPPKVPTVSGPSEAYQWSAPLFSFTTTDPNKDKVIYIIDWGDNSPMETTSEYNSGETAYVDHQFITAQTFSVKAKAMDIKGNIQEEWSTPFSITILPNGRPTKPTITSVIPNLQSVATGESAYFVVSGSNDPDGDSIQYQFIWKKGAVITSPLMAGGGSFLAGYNFPEAGNYNIKAIAIDKKGAISDSSDSYQITALDEGSVIATFLDTIVGIGDFRSPAIFISAAESVLVLSAPMTDEPSYYSLFQLNLKTLKKARADGLGEDYVYDGTVAIDELGNIYVANDESRLYSRSSNLGPRWRYPNYEDSTLDISTAPALVGNYVVFGTGSERKLYILNRDNGIVAATVSVGSGVRSSPVINSAGQIIFADEIGYLWKVTTTGTVKWKIFLGGPFDAAPCLSGNMVYIPNSTTNGKLFAVQDLGDSARKVWEYTSGHSVSSSPVIGTDGYLYFGDDEGYIHAVDPNTGQAKGGYPIQLTDRLGSPITITSTPAFAQDGIFYILAYDEGILFAVNIDGTVRWYKDLGIGGKIKKMAYEDVDPSVIIGPDGTIYCPTAEAVFAVKGRTTGTPANTPWPRWRHDNRNTGNAGTAPTR